MALMKKDLQHILSIPKMLIPNAAPKYLKNVFIITPRKYFDLLSIILEKKFINEYETFSFSNTRS